MDERGARERVRVILSELVFFLKNALLLFRQNFKVVTVFILFCSVFSLLATTVLTSVTTKLLMLVTGNTYISPANLRDVILNPPSILVLLAEQIIATQIALFQISGLLHAFSMGQFGLETDLDSMFATALRTCRKAAYPKNWLIVVFLLVLMPLSKVMPLAGSTYKLIVPGFVNQTIDYTVLYNIAYNILYSILLCLVLVYIFSINIFVLRDVDFMTSCAESRRLGKGRYLKTVLFLGTLMLLTNFLINSVASAITINISEFVALFSSAGGIVTRSVAVGTYTYALRQLLQSLLIPAVNNAGLAVCFFLYLDEAETIGTLSRETFRRRSVPRPVRRAISAVAGIVLVGSGFFLATHYAYLGQTVDRPLVCAHRGDNVNAPENTMPAFELAYSENLSWIELDVHQTSDGIIVCSHDSSIGRVTGHDLEICEHTYAELAQYEMGEWMPGIYEHVTIPTLEEVLLSARAHGVNVQVELKGSKGDKDFEEHVLEVIQKTSMHDNVMVICQDASRMMRVAELDPTITKGYCMFVAQGRIEDIPYTDNVTIEESNVNPDLVRRLHDEGIKVFCWTVDLEDTVQYLVSCDVDVIGTDNPLLVSAALDHADYRGGLPRILNILLNIMANMAR
ncbi:MAG: glycerophosphoryl diester phosphodiesterase membrane domain-containing protein [Atopobiaceae bacterium]|nr:glycerophosphoryl diester phosphodiesterase membrane domain-containing protein [Atopobiaceae bacterium]MBR3312531.1 glycerophosphoryl diester phosphodiesterase membrane domain-containing protein [Atopobiaceae bacterium]